MGGIKLRLQGVGAHHWILGRRNGLARDIHYWLREDDRFPGKQILPEVQWRLNTAV